jgi:hypothetical protein
MHPDSVVTSDSIILEVMTQGDIFVHVVSAAPYGIVTHRFVSGRFNTYGAAKREQRHWLSGSFGWPPKFQERDRV